MQLSNPVVRFAWKAGGTLESLYYARAIVRCRPLSRECESTYGLTTISGQELWAR